ncbi:unnamed protein product, partial [Prorocentrum cordatum]
GGGISGTRAAQLAAGGTRSGPVGERLWAVVDPGAGSAAGALGEADAADAQRRVCSLSPWRFVPEQLLAVLGHGGEPQWVEANSSRLTASAGWRAAWRSEERRPFRAKPYLGTESTQP